MNNLDKYFPDLSASRKEKILKLTSIYRTVNKKINVISRKDIDNIFLHHILPAMAISKVVTFKNQSNILDIGSGGGFPGVPLAILFNKAKFTLIDSRKKKCEAMIEVIAKLKLRNINIKQVRSNELKEKFNYIIGRAVTEPSEFMKLATKNLKNQKKEKLIFYISGGGCQQDINKINVSNFFKEEYFKDKYIYISP